MSTEKQTESPRAMDLAVGSSDLLGCVESDIAPLRAQLIALRQKYEDGGERRIGWEIFQAVGPLDEAARLARLYLSGTPLPTLAEMRGILKQPNADLSHSARTRP